MGDAAPTSPPSGGIRTMSLRPLAMDAYRVMLAVVVCATAAALDATSADRGLTDIELRQLLDNARREAELAAAAHSRAAARITELEQKEKELKDDAIRHYEAAKTHSWNAKLAEDQHQQLKAKHEAAEAQRRELEAKHEALLVQHAEVDRNNRDLAAKHDALSATHAEVEKRRQSLSTKHDTLLIQHAEAQKERNELAIKHEALLAKHTEVDKAKTQLETGHRMNQEHRKQLQVQIALAEQRAGQYQAATRVAESKAKALQKKLEDLQVEMKQKDVQHAQELSDQLQFKPSATPGESQDPKAAAQQQATGVRLLREARAHIERCEKQLLDEKQTCSTRLEAQDAQMDALKTAEAGSKDEVTQCMKKAEEDMQAGEARVDELKTQLSDLQGATVSLKGALTSCETKRQQALEASKEENAELRSQLSDLRQSASIAKEALAQCSDLRVRLTEQRAAHGEVHEKLLKCEKGVHEDSPAMMVASLAGTLRTSLERCNRDLKAAQEKSATVSRELLEVQQQAANKSESYTESDLDLLSASRTAVAVALVAWAKADPIGAAALFVPLLLAVCYGLWLLLLQKLCLRLRGKAKARPWPNADEQMRQAQLHAQAHKQLKRPPAMGHFYIGDDEGLDDSEPIGRGPPRAFASPWASGEHHSPTNTPRGGLRSQGGAPISPRQLSDFHSPPMTSTPPTGGASPTGENIRSKSHPMLPVDASGVLQDKDGGFRRMNSVPGELATMKMNVPG
eukprot:gnl/TRDRNA2_/TRDRNA2_140377_c0_seq1.p1 gnl/TRDRNA2_/TRDRNA2_140377_c0~~gnl/TRDRNA2_/TRDRNA2_140377_c0_seq1.p1  ORF type:complete len:747 (-),score=165.03 gnl/TRDRNA2_/TRDRNA2_140377_c0_seq1:227-2446(-)